MVEVAGTLVSENGIEVSSDAVHEILNWFSSASASQRLELTHAILLACAPLEIRFLGTCLEELFRRDQCSFRETERLINEDIIFETEFASHLFFCNGNNVGSDLAEMAVSDDCIENSDILRSTSWHILNNAHTRGRLLLRATLLRSNNTVGGFRLGHQLVECAPAALILMAKCLSGAKCHVAEEVLLLYSMVARHPAIGFLQRLYLAQTVVRLRLLPRNAKPDTDHAASSTSGGAAGGSGDSSSRGGLSPSSDAVSFAHVVSKGPSSTAGTPSSSTSGIGHKHCNPIFKLVNETADIVVQSPSTAPMLVKEDNFSSYQLNNVTTLCNQVGPQSSIINENSYSSLEILHILSEKILPPASSGVVSHASSGYWEGLSKNTTTKSLKFAELKPKDKFDVFPFVYSLNRRKRATCAANHSLRKSKLWVSHSHDDCVKHLANWNNRTSACSFSELWHHRLRSIRSAYNKEDNEFGEDFNFVIKEYANSKRPKSQSTKCHVYVNSAIDDIVVKNDSHDCIGSDNFAITLEPIWSRGYHDVAQLQLCHVTQLLTNRVMVWTSRYNFNSPESIQLPDVVFNCLSSQYSQHILPRLRDYFSRLVKLPLHVLCDARVISALTEAANFEHINHDSGLSDCIHCDALLESSTPKSTIDAPNCQRTQLTAQYAHCLAIWLKRHRMHKYYDCLLKYNFAQLLLLDRKQLLKENLTRGAVTKLLGMLEILRMDVGVFWSVSSLTSLCSSSSIVNYNTFVDSLKPKKESFAASQQKISSFCATTRVENGASSVTAEKKNISCLTTREQNKNYVITQEKIIKSCATFLEQKCSTCVTSPVKNSKFRTVDLRQNIRFCAANNHDQRNSSTFNYGFFSNDMNCNDCCFKRSLLNCHSHNESLSVAMNYLCFSILGVPRTLHSNTHQ